MERRRLTDVALAVALVVGGAVHLRLYFNGYRDVPDANLGRSFLANAAASALVAVAVLIAPRLIVLLSAAGIANGSLAAFWLSRTSAGVFGFTEHGFHPSPEAAIAVIAEIAVSILAVVRLAELSDRPVHAAM
jgi:hypothetical protein